MNLNDPSFINQLKCRDHHAIEFLIEKYHETLYFSALKNKLGADQAEEVVQATWSTFFEKIENFEGRSHIRTYLFGILFNKIKELWRSNKKYTHEYDEREIDDLFDEYGFYKNSPMPPEQWAQSSEILEIIDEELEKLPNNQRLAFFLKEIQGEKTEDICNILSVSSTNLGVLLYRAKNNLRLKIEKRMNK